MLYDFKLGQTSVVLRLKLRNSSSASGAGLTGLTSASSGLRIAAIADVEATSTAYTVAGSTIDTIATLGTYAAPTATHCRFKEVDATNHPGLYEFQFENSRFSVAGAKALTVTVSGATNLAESDFVIPLRSVDPYDAVRGGMTALPNAVAAAAGGLLTFGASTGQVNPSGGKVPATLASTDVTGNVACDLQTIKTQAVTAAAGVTFPSSVGTSTFAGGAVASVTGAVGSVTASVTVGTNNDKTGYSLLVTPPTTPAIATAVWQALLAGSNFTTVGSIGEQVKANVAIVGGYSTGQDPATLVLDALASGHNTASSIGAKINAAGTASDPWGTALPGSYTSGTAGALLGALTTTAIATATLDLANGVETGETVRQFFRQLRAVAYGLNAESSGTSNFKRKDGTTTSVSVTHDTLGNRTVSTSGTN